MVTVAFASLAPLDIVYSQQVRNYTWIGLLGGLSLWALMRALEADPAMGFVVMRRLTEVISGRLQNLQRVVLKTL